MSNPPSSADRNAPWLSGRPAWRSVLVNIVLFAGVMYVFATHLNGVSASLRALQTAQLGWIALAALVVMLTFVLACTAFVSLGYPKVRLWPTLQVQMASGFVNRLLPAGLGGLGLFALYFRKSGYSLSTASALVVTNNILGLIGNNILLLAILAVTPPTAWNVRWPQISPTGAAVAGIGILLAIGLYLHLQRRRQQRVLGGIKSLGHAVRLALSPNRRTAGALAANIALTALNAVILCLSATAVGTAIGWPAAVLVVSLGSFVGAAVPTPGGIGGVEAGLVTGLLSVGVAPDAALAVALIYRGLTYWLPILPGVLVFRHIKNRYIMSSI